MYADARRYTEPRLPNQRWQMYPANPTLAQSIANTHQLSPLIAQVAINRGADSLAKARDYLNPELLDLPHPLEEFPDLAFSIELLESAIASGEKIAICGDYDADGMTSTALLWRALGALGAKINYAIPSRMHEGYGINTRIVEEFHAEGVKLILTVDNGIAAYEPIARARELGLKVIVTDHHDLPPNLPPAHAILNPKLLPQSSPYWGLAGVGMAYVLAVTLAQQLRKDGLILRSCLELFTLGTIADLAPLKGVNRRWLKRGLAKLPQSQLAGIQALIQVSGVSDTQKALKPDDIGFRLGPRINAVGRLADPQIVIELLTTDNPGVALERAMQCEQINKHRQQLCEEIEQQAIAWVEESLLDLQAERVLVVVQPGWHHGVIGIVASRLVERYGVPVFIGTHEDDTHIRGSARSIPEFNVFEALQFCSDLLGKFGGHQAAGGFSLPAENLEALQTRLSQFAHQCLQLQHLKPLVKVDALADFAAIDAQLYQQIEKLQPCGIENDSPTFWTADVRILEQKVVGKNHLKVTFAQDRRENLKILNAIAWRWGQYYPLPTRLDIAYRLRENTWNGNTNVELELVGARLPEVS
ncbi:single-stranded-DNA-specific exonuclease RecJ [Desertifilum sp. FACHB-1129]|uniref:single-stranded-DNA-specific exonuclease RecJ n=1 Tax=Desertifilum TaxID=1185872 RepID=UPI0009F61180|nr:MULTISPECIES: single-stranded-DNA-specific exonuclease RecJ [Desertifilum]MBD2313511.1 single-stranded-DNA-specific exonuclease RecJ [Desertifilum sp. FACHB-1129]MBD2323843.1 single-stranded-DNA-specific exonuclease RecJ [Desertifilum sp. FACHB-866]MBD2333688.1 single-stranded-DNA-specific exonuclease RecJ [Desertifilum sp. FACHB-868]MDA0211442.1 single-stranded-DNA-specific exonuclease RecJ [Cyanobacteria bacterium FC1]